MGNNPLLSFLRILLFFSTTVAMIVLIRVIGEDFQRHIWLFLLLMFSGQVVLIGTLVILQKLISPQEPSPTDRNFYLNPVVWIMAGLLTTNAAGVFCTGGYISGPTSTVLNCTPMITILLFDRFLLGARISIWHVVNVALIIVGMAIGLVGVKDDTHTSWIAAIIMIVALSFTPMLGIMKDAWFRKRPVWHPLAGEQPNILPNVCLYMFLQIPFHILYLPFYGAVDMPAFDEIGHNFKTGLECIFAMEDGYSSGEGLEAENCKLVVWLWISVALITMIQILSSFYIARYESGAYSIVVQSACPFAADAIFGWHALMGDDYTEPVDKMTWISLGIIAVGTIGFHYSEKLVERSGDTETEKTASSFKRWILKRGLPTQLYASAIEKQRLLNP